MKEEVFAAIPFRSIKQGVRELYIFLFRLNGFDVRVLTTWVVIFRRIRCTPSLLWYWVQKYLHYFWIFASKPAGEVAGTIFRVAFVIEEIVRKDRTV